MTGELDPNNPVDAIQLDGNARPRDYDYQKINLNALLKYRFNNEVSLTLTDSGYAALDGTVQTGIGTVRAEDFGYSYLQRSPAGGRLFAQVYKNFNNAGKSFVYDNGLAVVDNSTQLNVQAQYDFDINE
ncbi:MAG: hypothetical protein R3C26_19060 [Calditrichia bacterium]